MVFLNFWVVPLHVLLALVLQPSLSCIFCLPCHAAACCWTDCCADEMTAVVTAGLSAPRGVTVNTEGTKLWVTDDVSDLDVCSTVLLYYIVFFRFLLSLYFLLSCPGRAGGYAAVESEWIGATHVCIVARCCLFRREGGERELLPPLLLYCLRMGMLLVRLMLLVLILAKSRILGLAHACALCSCTES